MDSPAADSALRAAMHDADAWVRYFAVRSMKGQRAVESSDKLLRIAEGDAALPVRVAAVDALGYLQSDSSIPLLLQLTDAADPDLKQAALTALGPVARNDVVAVLVAAASAADLSTRLAAIRALGTGKARQSVEALSQLATAVSDPDAVLAAIDALEFSPSAYAGEALLALTLEPGCRDLCIMALARLDESHLDQIALGLRHEMLDVRRAAVEALSRQAAPRARELLKSALDDPHKSIRQAAIKSLAVSLAPFSRESGP
jgi:HEAT repeat protein